MAGLKSPEDCVNLQEVRIEIDRIDREMIGLIGKRYAYVKAAAKFKTSEASVNAQERVTAMLQMRRGWAEEIGLDPNVIEKLYTDLVHYFIQEEMKTWREKDA